jgi:DNA-binding NtrC family response regulator
LEIQASFERLVEHLCAAGFFMEEAVELLEKNLITRTMARTGGNQTETSRLLGIHRNTLQKKMTQYSLSAASFRRKPAKRSAGNRKKPEAA